MTITAVIASPLSAAVVDRIVASAPADVEVVYRPDLVPPPRYTCDHTGDPAFRRTPEQEAEWRGILRNAEITWDFPESGGDGPAELTPNLKWVQGTSAGVGARVRRLGLQDRPEITVTTASGIHARPLAEYVFGALLAHVKHVRHLAAQQRSHHWERFTPDSLDGKTMVLIGPGRIGREVARLAKAFDMTVLALARDSDPGRAVDLGVDRVFTRDQLHGMLGQADVVVLCAPQTPETDDIMGAAAFAALRPGTIFVNIGRGTLVDEDALLAALRDGRVGFAVLDVFRQEPLPADSPFWDEPNVQVSPHSVANAANEYDKIADIFIANLARYVDGRTDEMTPRYSREKGY
ncbi:MAG: D-3-phosphoglycerate dehydrogenase [uncultured Thermomicrobiales bacterium]|uniref:D-3-phosphoglycerate dehydrogenase n=1 Tax=uncultured Thermomicrobiales bacterium TaxID=1645740 RepID=A0A6J4VNB8_9BACT|nr:MAG: D-3-phosphoglycerate dehydrogenase [uncultured Thermomicrobiales bacterium]